MIKLHCNPTTHARASLGVVSNSGHDIKVSYGRNDVVTFTRSFVNEGHKLSSIRTRKGTKYIYSYDVLDEKFFRKYGELITAAASAAGLQGFTIGHDQAILIDQPNSHTTFVFLNEAPEPEPVFEPHVSMDWCDDFVAHAQTHREHQRTIRKIRVASAVATTVGLLVSIVQARRR